MNTNNWGKAARGLFLSGMLVSAAGSGISCLSTLAGFGVPAYDSLENYYENKGPTATMRRYVPPVALTGLFAGVAGLPIAAGGIVLGLLDDRKKRGKPEGPQPA